MPEDLNAPNTVPTAFAGGWHTVWKWAKRLGLSILLVVAVAWWDKNRLEIEPIGVTKKLTEDGFSVDVVTQRLRDAIKEVQDRTKIVLEKAGRIDVQEDMPDVTIPGTGISAHRVVRYLLPESWQQKITGEFIMSGAELSLRVRLNGEVVVSDVSTASNAVDVLIDKAALKLVERMQPYIAAVALLDMDDLSGAGQLADQIINSLPPEDEDVIQAYILKAIIAEHQQDAETAVAFYLKYPNSASARRSLGHFRYYYQNRLEEAISEIRQAIKLDPKNAQSHIELGDLLGYGGGAQNNTEEAISEFRQAIRLDPKNPWSHTELGERLIRWEHIKLAEGLIRQGNPAGMSERLISEFRQANTAEAISEFRQAIRLGSAGINGQNVIASKNPSNAVAHYDLGDTLRDQNKSAEAISEFRQAIRLGPKNATSHYSLGKILADQVGPETPKDQAVGLLTEACEQIQLAARLAHDPYNPDYPSDAHRIDAKFAGRGHCPPQ
jgi:tetratricopeptide (TPR) repeat protein